eukprot:TRINITY_DN45672_c0_g1_i1.p1 TRINITY_DN45672_c0_g1~~TRINITY_DN45672_c0_g1_i1.p1  ORF type:complete len:128 (-),score=18.91 TRINITY_DN45672_c0_g1_i1:143-526(-)
MPMRPSFPAFSMDLKDIPDRWKRFNPETPPYKFFPGRTRKQTMVYSWVAIAAFAGVGYFLAEVVDRHNKTKDEMYADYAQKNMSFEQRQMLNNQEDALREIMMKARRQRLGLETQKHGTVDIQDPFE